MSKKDYNDSSVRYRHINHFLGQIETLMDFLDNDYCNSGNTCQGCPTQKICRAIGDIQDSFSVFRIAVKEEYND